MIPSAKELRLRPDRLVSASGKARAQTPWAMFRTAHADVGTMRVVIGGVESTFRIENRDRDSNPDPFDIGQYSVDDGVSGQRYATPVIPVTGLLESVTFLFANSGFNEQSFFKVCDNPDCSDVPNFSQHSSWRRDVTVSPGQYLQIAITAFNPGHARSLRITGGGIDTTMVVRTP